MIDKDTIKRLKELLSDDDINIIQKVEQRRKTADYFFARAKSIRWFEPLLILGYFGPINSSGKVQESLKDETDLVTNWNVLSYVENISEYLSDPQYSKYLRITLDFIRIVTKWLNNNSASVDKYRTFYSFLKILRKLPNAKIPIDVIKLIPYWLKSNHGADLPGSELLTKFLPKFLTEKATAADIKKVEMILNFITVLNWEKASRSYVDLAISLHLEIHIGSARY